MKLLAFIFGIFILTLNALPCTDADVFSDNSQTEVVVASNVDHNHSALDLCPPFCTCHCCHVHTVDFDSTNFKPINQQVSSKIFLHFDPISEEPIRSLLDPPRV